MNWSNEIPETSGHYWFYGDPFTLKNDETLWRKELHMVQIKKISNGHMYIASGHFMENKIGLWHKAVVPNIPE